MKMYVEEFIEGEMMVMVMMMMFGILWRQLSFNVRRETKSLKLVPQSVKFPVKP